MSESANALNDFTRQACIAALRHRTVRRAVLGSYLTSAATPRPVEVGLDAALLLRTTLATCRRLSLDALRALATGALAGVVAGALLDLDLMGSFGLALATFYLASVLLYAKWAALRESSLVASFWPERHDPQNLPPELQTRISPYGDGLNESTQNLTVHVSNRQFVGFGIEIADWKLALDTQKPAKASSSRPQELHVFEVADAIRTAFKDNCGVGTLVSNHFFLDGRVLPNIVEIAPSTIGRAPPSVPPALEAKWQQSPQSAPARDYLLCNIFLQGDLVLTYAIRILRHPRHLTLEVHHLVLPPISPRWAQTLRCGRSLVDNWTAHIPGALLAGPYEHLTAVVGGLDPTGLRNIDNASRLWAYHGFHTEPLEDAPAAEARMTSFFRWHAWNGSTGPMNGRTPDFGCAASIRETLSSDSISSYSEREELRLYSRLMDKSILDALREILLKKGISTDDFDETRQTIVNSGVLIQDGNINAASVSVGAGSSAVSVGAKQKPEARRNFRGVKRG